jgi:xanthine dehydrogenase accessory factor
MQRQAALARSWDHDGRRAAVARVIATEGLGPRAAGDLLLVDDSGTTSGRLLEGTVDAATVAAARTLLERGGPSWRAVQAVIAHDDATAAGLTCGGRATVVVQRLDAIPSHLWDALAHGQPVALVSALTTTAGTLVVQPGEAPQGDLLTIDPAAAERGTAEAAALLARRGVATLQLEQAGSTLVIDVWNPVPRLVILGSGALADALARQADLLEWQPVPSWTAVGTADIIDGLTTADALVVIEHDHEQATPILAAALRAGVGYVGALGSRTTQAERQRHLAATDLTDVQRARLHGPAGLDLGATSPAEAAVSIVAEIIAVRSGRTATPLRTTTGSIKS